jgi:hypothetical protein
VRLAQVLDGKTDPEDLHALYEVPPTPEVEQPAPRPLSTAAVAA